MSDLLSLTSNQYWGGINKRFERRARFLRRAGFRQVNLCGGVSGFVRPVNGHLPVPNAGAYVGTSSCPIPVASVMHCDKRAWLSLLSGHLVSGLHFGRRVSF